MGFFDSLLGGLTGKDGKDSGNPFGDGRYVDRANNAYQNFMDYKGDANALDSLQSSRTATKEVQDNPILAGLFGKGGQLDQANSEATNLANTGYQLTPEDRTAYGQASGDIARQFDASEGNLAQALAARGMTNSGAAAQGIMGSQGNKLEMLGQLQNQIAQNRMQTNMQRLAQTRNFISQLGAQGENAIQNQYGRQMGSEQQKFNELQGQAGMGQHYLEDMANVASNNFAQQQQTRQPGLAEAFGTGLTSAFGAAPKMAAQGALSAAFGKPPSSGDTSTTGGK